MVNIKIKSIKSDLYSIIETINHLNLKYRDGQISDIFYAKSIKIAYNNLLKINFTLKDSGLALFDLLDEMKYTEKYQNAIKIIKNIAEVKEDKNSPLSILDLPGTALEITSSLITLMDILKLGIIEDYSQIDKTFREIVELFEKFPGMEDLNSRILKLRNVLSKNKKSLITDKKYQDYVGEKLYVIFKDFQKKLNKPSPSKSQN